MTSTRRTSGALPAEAARWLAVDLGSRPAQVVVAGVTGGSGPRRSPRWWPAASPPTARRPAPGRPSPSSTTTAAPCTSAAARPVPVGRAGQGVGCRPGRAPRTPLPRVRPAPADADVLLRCLGAQALNPEPTLLDDPTVVAVVVVPWHQDGLALGENAADRLGVDRTVVVPVDVTRARTGGAVLGLPWDRALAAPGEITERALAPATRRAVLAVTAEVLAAARRVAVLTAG